MRTTLISTWAAFRRPGRLVALAVAGVLIAGLGLLIASGNRSSCDGPCPVTPTADGSAVADRFWFVHRDLASEGSITVRLTAMTGTITYPPPDHDEIVPGLVPWAKTGIIVKDGLDQGSAYAALMMTGDHGVRMQYDYVHDIAGGAGDPTAQWLRLVRSGDTITGYESADGETWDEVGTAVLEDLPETVQVGMFATSPGDLTLREVALGGILPESRFTQAVGTFDHIGLEGAGEGVWQSDPVGEMNHTDWEKFHNASGSVEDGDQITVSGTGDIGPLGVEGLSKVDLLLQGLVLALIVVLVVGARFGAASAGQVSRRDLGARAAWLGAAVLVIGLAAVTAAVVGGYAVMDANGVPVDPVPAATGVRIVAGLAAVLALSTVFAFALGVWLRRGRVAVLASLALVALPFALASYPLLPDAAAQWLLRVTPAAAFAVKQVFVEYPQVTAHYAPSDGYFPLPPWAGVAVLCAYIAAAAWLALRARRTAV